MISFSGQDDLGMDYSDGSDIQSEHSMYLDSDDDNSDTENHIIDNTVRWWTSKI